MTNLYINYCLFRKFKNINEDLTSQKPLMLDSVISPSAVNMDFYKKIALLQPYGSGNPEPRFMIENLNFVTFHEKTAFKIVRPFIRRNQV